MKKIIISFFLVFSTQARKLDLNFKVETNMPGITVAGKTNQSISLPEGAAGEVEVDIKNLTTDMELRDEHMRNEVFMNKNVKVGYENADCLNKEVCKVNLSIVINDQTVKRVVELKKNNQSHQGSLKLNLAEFKIKEPSRFGVRVLPEVDLEFSVVH